MEDQVIIGYAPAFRAVTGWQNTFRQEWSSPGDLLVRRVVWQAAEDPDSRILVDVAESSTATGAAMRLEIRERQSSVALKHGSRDHMGPVALHQVADDPWTHLFRVANLTIWVYSCGGTRLNVMPWVEKIQGDIEAQMNTSRQADLVLEAEAQGPEQAGSLFLRFSLPWDRGAWAWWKFQATDGTLAKGEGNKLILTPRGAGGASVIGWAVEPGRETHWGRYPDSLSR